MPRARARNTCSRATRASARGGAGPSRAMPASSSAASHDRNTRSRSRDGAGTGRRLGREARHMFIVPWREFTLIGVWHKLFRRTRTRPHRRCRARRLDPRDQLLLSVAAPHARGRAVQELRPRAFRRRDPAPRSSASARNRAISITGAPRRRWARHADRHPLHDGARRCRGRTRHAAQAVARGARPRRHREEGARRRRHRDFEAFRAVHTARARAWWVATTLDGLLRPMAPRTSNPGPGGRERGGCSGAARYRHADGRGDVCGPERNGGEARGRRA